MAIGYEVLVTPLQVVRFYGALANNGIMLNATDLKIEPGSKT